MRSDLKNKLVRLLNQDASLWQDWPHIEHNVRNWMGWVDVVPWMQDHIPNITCWIKDADAMARRQHIVLLGMGGSSLAAEVFFSIFGKQKNFPDLRILDSTSPAQIIDFDLNPQNCLFIVASKSGTTVETVDLYSYFFHQLSQISENPGRNFIAITDENSWLQAEAIDKEFAKIFINPADIAGRYSALSYFGLVPAGLIGVDLVQLQAQLVKFVARLPYETGDEVVDLARLMAQGEASGKNQLYLNCTTSICSLALWIEQLVAESTGKQGRGILPVYGAEVVDAARRISVQTEFDTEKLDTKADLTFRMRSAYDLGCEFFRWQLATSLAAVLMGINPFDQPNVEEAKQKSKDFVFKKARHTFQLLSDDQNLSVYYSQISRKLNTKFTTRESLQQFFDNTSAALYLGILAFLPIDKEIEKRLQEIRRAITAKFNITSTIGYGPRYLHSTGQLHKGGSNEGCFIQILEDQTEVLSIPERIYGFHQLHLAQADGDYSVLENKGRSIMRISLKGDRLAALENLLKEID